MSVLKKILNEYGGQTAAKNETLVANENPQIDSCPNCDGNRWWLPRGQMIWRCERCDQPVSDALVSDRRNNDPVIISESTVTCCVPWCTRCGGWQGREITWSNERVTTQCKSCQHPMPDWPNPVTISTPDPITNAEI